LLSLLLPALATEVAQSTAPPANADEDAYPLSPDGGKRPYLVVVGAPQLRFLEAVPPPDVSVRPPAGAPPIPTGKPEPEIVQLPAKVSGGAAFQAPPAPKDRVEEMHERSSASPVIQDRPAPPPAILPDDAGRKVRPEDFLPFFQFPGSGATADDINIIPPAPPAPGRLPLSTATYQQR
jgi:hypothetical protein